MLSGLLSDVQEWQHYVEATNTSFTTQTLGDWIAADNVQALHYCNMELNNGVPFQLAKKISRETTGASVQC